MKIFLVSFFMLSAFTAQAGIIKNKKTGDSINIDIDESNRIVYIIVDTNGQQTTSQISLKRFNLNADLEPSYTYNEVAFDYPMGGTQELLKSDFPTGLKVIFFVPTLVLDTLFFPAIFPVNLLNQNSAMNISKDIKVFQRALAEKEYKKNVSNKRFKRLLRLTDHLKSPRINEERTF